MGVEISAPEFGDSQVRGGAATVAWMQRILVIGSGGSGKSTVAKEIASRLGLPLVHLDSLYWHPGWRATENSAWDRVVEELIAAPRWVIDGNYGRTLDVRLTRCDTVIFLDLPRVVCLWRAVKRRLAFRGRNRPDMAPDCPERLTWEFVRWIWTYPGRRRADVLHRLARLGAGQRAIVLSSSREVRRFLNELRAPSHRDLGIARGDR
jgi:adenylate kinase family enzyme